METERERDWMTREEAAAFVGDNDSFYLEKWKSHSDTMLKGWNWSAMTFGIEWMAYRKMYVEILLVFVVNFCISAVAVFLLPFLSGNLLSYCVRLLIGMFGNALYRKKALRILRDVDVENEAARIEALSREGGISPISVVVLILLEFLYAYLIV